ncbi:hypothetical protein NDI44_02570 [Trichocoleus sp. DQ-A3]|nr:hypothetical protein [Coleofasciculus sp. FACHB-129]
MPLVTPVGALELKTRNPGGTRSKGFTIPSAHVLPIRGLTPVIGGFISIH